jgi:hypothetical protein
VASNPITISGIESAPISIFGGEYSIDGGPFMSAPGTVLNGQSVVVRVTASTELSSTSHAVLRVGAASAVFGVATPIGRGTNVVYFRSEAGDPVGRGEEKLLYSGTLYDIRPDQNQYNGASFIVIGRPENWRLDLSAPGQARMVPQAYSDLAAYPFPGSKAGLQFTTGSPSCSTVAGRFDVFEIEYGADGVVTKLAANFEQHCDGRQPALFGRIRYNSNLPLFDRSVRGDHNGDGKADILWRHATTGFNALWQMNGSSYADGVMIPTVSDTNWRIAGTGDFNGDGKADLLWRNAVTGDNAVWLMNGSALDASALIAAVPDAAWRIVGRADFDGDGRTDVLWRNSVTGQNAIWLMNGAAVAGAELIAAVPDTAWIVAGTGDFDGNGKVDILWRHSATGDMAVWLMNGSTLASSALLQAVPGAWLVAGVADYDGDGRSDILWRNIASGDNAIWIMNGAAVANGAFIDGVPDAQWTIVGASDFDADGKADILWRNTRSGENAIWLMDGVRTKNSALIPGVPDGDWKVVTP